MELAKEKEAAFQSTVELMMEHWNELDRHLKVCLKSENQDAYDSKMIELNEKKDEFLLKVRELELMERISQQELEEKEKDLEQRSQTLAKRETKLHAELEGIKRREAKLHLGMKQLENLKEGFEIKKMMSDLKTEGVSGASSSQSKPSNSAVKMEGVQRKRKRAAASASVKMEGVQRKRRRDASGQDGLSFWQSIVKTHDRTYMTVPAPFVSAYDMSAKKYVILSTDKGDFRLEVRRYSTRSIVHFCQGWKDFYAENLLKVGCQCLFRLKENTVNGDALGFSMDVSVINP